MQIVYRYNLQPGKATAFRDWLIENDEVFRKESPPGWTYLGSWFTVQGLGRLAVENRWELDDYSALGAGFGTEKYQAVLNEWEDYADLNSSETTLMKSVEDVTIA